MDLAVLGLIALGAVTHATWNVAIKGSGAGGPSFVWMTGIVAAVVVLPFALLTTPSWPEWRILGIAALVSGILHVAYFLLLQSGYRVGDVSVVYPLARGTGPLLSVIGAIVLSVVNHYLLPEVLCDLPSKVGLDFDLSMISSGLYGLILVVVMLLRPQGLFGRAG